MIRTPFHRTLDLTLLWTFCLLVSSGLVMKYRFSGEYLLPSGTTVMGLTWHSWARLHLWLGWILSGLVILHVATHWNWIWNVAVNNLRTPLAYALWVALLLLLVPLLAPRIDPRPTSTVAPAPTPAPSATPSPASTPDFSPFDDEFNRALTP